MLQGLIWHLSVGDKEVAVVTRTRRSPDAQIFFEQDGQLSLRSRLAVASNIFEFGLNRIYHRGIKYIPILAFFLLGLSFGAWAIWRKRGKAWGEAAARLG
jgi:hypothetical protein